MLCQQQVSITGRASTYCMQQRGHDGDCIPEAELNKMRAAYGVQPAPIACPTVFVKPEAERAKN